MASSRLERIGTILSRVEGLILKGVIKRDERPIWFDVYKKFPPSIEPKFSRPKPEIKPLRQIFYKEDLVRVKFHSKGHGLGGFNMLSTEGETTTKRLLQQYEKLQSEGVSEDKIIDQCVTAVESERRISASTASTTDTVKPKSVTQQVKAQLNVRSIFKEE